MTPLKKDLAILELNVFFHIVNSGETWVLNWRTLRKDWPHRITSDMIINSNKINDAT